MRTVDGGREEKRRKGKMEFFSGLFHSESLSSFKFSLCFFFFPSSFLFLLTSAFRVILKMAGYLRNSTMKSASRIHRGKEIDAITSPTPYIIYNENAKLRKKRQMYVFFPFLLFCFLVLLLLALDILLLLFAYCLIICFLLLLAFFLF